MKLPQTDYTPASIYSERYVLGAILLDNLALDITDEMDLSVGEFALQEHRDIFKGMWMAREKGEEIDFVSLGRLGLLGRLGDVSLTYLSSLTDELPGIEGIEDRIQQIKDTARERYRLHNPRQAEIDDVVKRTLEL